MTVSRKPLEEKPPSLGSLARLPVFLALDGKRVATAKLEFAKKDLPKFLSTWRLDF